MKDREQSAAMDDTATELKETCKEAVGLGPANKGFFHKCGWANIHKA